MRTLIKLFVLGILAFGIWLPAFAQGRLTAHAKADFVSNYVWRGSDQNSGFSVQPYLTLSWQGAFLTVNGSQSITNAQNAPQEFDINLGYGWRGLSLTISDYWWEGMQAPYGHYLTGHHFEATAAWAMKEICKLPLNLSWSTWFAGYDNYKSGSGGKSERAFSTYISISYDFALPSDLTLSPAIGFTPWQSVYHHQAGVTDLTLKASRTIRITDQFSLPFFVQAIFAPNDTAKNVDKTYLVAGFSIGF